VRENHRVSRGPITAEHLAGLPGLRHTARDALIARQPKTVLEALSIPDVGRKATRYLLAAGLVADPERVQSRTLAEATRHRRR
jgi:hypothetical protein